MSNSCMNSNDQETYGKQCSGSLVVSEIRFHWCGLPRDHGLQEDGGGSILGKKEVPVAVGFRFLFYDLFLFSKRIVLTFTIFNVFSDF